MPTFHVDSIFDRDRYAMEETEGVKFPCFSRHLSLFVFLLGFLNSFLEVLEAAVAVLPSDLLATISQSVLCRDPSATSSSVIEW